MEIKADAMGMIRKDRSVNGGGSVMTRGGDSPAMQWAINWRGGARERRDRPSSLEWNGPICVRRCTWRYALGQVKKSTGRTYAQGWGMWVYWEGFSRAGGLVGGRV